MATDREVDQAEIRKQIDTLVEAIRGADLEALKPLYAADVCRSTSDRDFRISEQKRN